MASQATADACFSKIAVALGKTDDCESLPLDADFAMEFESVFELDTVEVDTLGQLLDRNKDGGVSIREFRSFHEKWTRSGKSLPEYLTGGVTKAVPVVKSVASHEHTEKKLNDAHDAVELEDLKLAVTQTEKRLGKAQLALTAASVVATVGAQLPFIGGAFGLCKEIIDNVQELKDKAADVAQAGRRATEVLEFVEALPSTLEKLGDEKRAQVESKLAPLEALLKDFGECVRAFASKGFLKKAWGMRKQLKTLGKVDLRITKLLEQVTRWFDLARGDRMLELLQQRATERSYPLGAEIDRRVSEHMASQGVSEEQAVAALVADPAVVQGVAAAANVSEAVFRDEIGAFREEMGARFDETQALLKGYGKALGSIEAKQDKTLDVLEQMRAEMAEQMRQMMAAIAANQAALASKELLPTVMALVQEQQKAQESATTVEAMEKVTALNAVVVHLANDDGAAASAAFEEGTVEETAAGLLAKGAALKAQKEWAPAVAALRAALDKDGTMASAWFDLGSCLEVGMKDFEGAEAAWRKAIELDPQNAMAHINLGKLLEDVRKDYDGAEAMYRKAVELDPQDGFAHSNLAFLLETVRRDDKGAEAMYRNDGAEVLKNEEGCCCAIA